MDSPELHVQAFSPGESGDISNAGRFRSWIAVAARIVDPSDRCQSLIVLHVGTFQDSFGTFFSDVIGGTKSIKDAFKDMLSSIEQMLSKLVAQKLTEQLFGGGTSGGGLLGGIS